MLAALAVVSGAACSDPDPESAQDRPAAEAASGGADSEGSGATGQADGDGSQAAQGADPDGEAGDDAAVGRTRVDPSRPFTAFVEELKAELFPEQYADLDRTALREQKTYECMTEHGFHYEVIDWAAIHAAQPYRQYAVSMGGYGLADSLLVELGPVEDLREGTPYEAITDGMSDDELRAWDDQFARCSAGLSEWFSEPDIVYWQFYQADKALFDQTNADPRVVAARAHWPECMAQRGHSYASQDAIFAHLERTAGPLRSRLRALGGPDHIDAEFRADLDDFRATEADIAVDDVACSEQVDQVVREVRAEHERRFMDENRDRLTALRQAIRGDLPSVTMPPYEKIRRAMDRDDWWPTNVTAIRLPG